MKHLTYVFLIIAALSVPMAAAADGHLQEYMVTLESLNGSGVTGTAWVTMEDGQFLTVVIEAEGLEAGRVHPQHIHGFNKPVKNSMCSTPEDDANGDGIVDIGEGGPIFGPIILALEPFDSLVTATTGDLLDYTETFQGRPNELQPLHKRTMVLHGMTVGGGYVPSTPVACGELVEVE